MNKTKILIFILLTSILSGIMLSSFSSNYSTVTVERPDNTCIGPAVIGFTCPSQPLKAERGYPVAFIFEEFVYDEDGVGFSDELVRVESKTSYSSYFLNSFLIISSTFLLFLAFRDFYKNIRNIQLKKLMNLVAKYLFVSIPLLFLILLVYEVSTYISRGLTVIELDVFPFGFIIWLAPVIVAFSLYQIRIIGAKITPILTLLLLTACLFLIYFGEIFLV